MSDTELIPPSFSNGRAFMHARKLKVRLPVDMNKMASLHEVTLRMEHVKMPYSSHYDLERFGLGNQEWGELDVIRSEWRW